MSKNIVAISGSRIAADSKTKRVDGEDLEKSAFAYQGSAETKDWKLPIKFSTDEKTKSHLRNAIARWNSTDMPNAEEKSRARGRIKAAAKEHDIDVEEGSLAKAKLKPFFRASLQTDGTLDLLVYEDIGADWWGDGGVTAMTVKQQLDGAGVYNRIAVRINSPGGDAFEGVAIMNLLRAQKKPVDVYIDGIAASAASIIAMAGDTITMGKSAMMMVHNAWTFCMGDGDDMRKCADTLDKISSSIGEAYSARTGKTASQVKAIMDAETWMSADDCLKEGFATAVATDDDDDSAMALAKSFKQLAKLKNVPAAFKPSDADEADDDICTCACGPCVDGDCEACTCTGCDSQNCGAMDCDCDAMATEPGAADSNLSQYEARLKLLRA